MGEYTEFEVQFGLKNTIPDYVIEAIHQMKDKNYLKVSGDKWDAGCIDLFQKEVVNLPEIDHPFWKCSRIIMIKIEFIDDNTIKASGDLKDYDNEINKFLNWISPYIVEPEGTKIGWYYENWGDTYKEPEDILVNDEHFYY